MNGWWLAVICLPVIIGIIGVTALLRAPREAQPDVLRALAELVRAAFRPLPTITRAAQEIVATAPASSPAAPASVGTGDPR